MKSQQCLLKKLFCIIRRGQLSTNDPTSYVWSGIVIWTAFFISVLLLPYKIQEIVTKLLFSLNYQIA